MANPYFNAVYYLANNPDVFAAGVTTATAWDHYVAYGAKEAYAAGGATRAPNAWFDAQFYLLNNQDLITAGVTPEMALDHFTNYGMYELRSPSQSVAAAPMTAESLVAYVNANEDIATAFGITVPATELTEAQQNQVISQYYANGYQENRPAAPVNVDPNPTETFTLTSSVDVATANKFISGEVVEFGNRLQTFNSGDNLTGSGDNPTLSVTWTGGAAAVVPTLSGIETLNVSNYSAAATALTITGNNVTGLKNVVVDNSVGDLTATNLQTKLESVTIKSTASDTSLQVANATVSGSADEIAINVNGALAGSSVIVNSVSGNNSYETLNIVASGAASVLDSVTTGDTGTKTVNFSGNQSVTLNSQAAANPLDAALTKIDATGMTAQGDTVAGVTIGGVSVAGAYQNGIASTVTTVGGVAINGGGGNDSFFITDFDNTYVINGGEGTDRVTVLGNAAITTSATVTNVEEMRFTANNGAGLGAGDFTVNLAGVSGVNKFVFDGSNTVANTGDITIQNNAFVAGTTLQFVGGRTANTQTFNGVNLNPTGATGGADTVNIVVGNQGLSVGATGNLVISDLGLALIENVTLTASDTQTGSSVVVNNVVAADLNALQTFTATATANLRIDELGNGSVSNANFSGVTGAVTDTAGGDLLVGQAANSIVTLAGSGNHNVTLNTAANAGTINAASATGNVTLTGNTGNDTLIGGSGNDTLRGGNGDDAITLGSGTDTVVLTGTSAITSALNNGGTDTVTGFAAGTGGDVLQFGSTWLGGGASFTSGNVTLGASNGLAAGNADDIYIVSDGADLNQAAVVTNAAAFSAGGSQKALFIADNGTVANIWYVDDSLDGNATDVTATDVVLIGTLNSVDAANLVAGNFAGVMV